MQRCQWCTNDPIYIEYHDHEWGRPSYDPAHLFELLLLEGFQAGLSWIIILKKRQRFREVLFNFDPVQLASINDDYINTLMQDSGIIRNRLKLNAIRTNARAWLAQSDPVSLVWSAVDGTPVINHYTCHDQIPTTTPAALTLSKTLKKAGFTFVGPTICYAYMQAAGMVMDHTTDCNCYKSLAKVK